MGVENCLCLFVFFYFFVLRIFGKMSIILLIVGIGGYSGIKESFGEGVF